MNENEDGVTGHLPSGEAEEPPGPPPCSDAHGVSMGELGSERVVAGGHEAPEREVRGRPEIGESSSACVTRPPRCPSPQQQADSTAYSAGRAGPGSLASERNDESVTAACAPWGHGNEYVLVRVSYTLSL